MVQRHAYCGCDFLNYRAWVWTLANGKEIEDPGNSGIGMMDSDKVYLHMLECGDKPLVSLNGYMES